MVPSLKNEHSNSTNRGLVRNYGLAAVFVACFLPSADVFDCRVSTIRR